MSESRVWYAAYGSNLAWGRFRCYIHGGAPQGSTKSYRGCRLKKDPERDRPYTLPRQLYFACRSPNWGNAGVAFIGHQAVASHPALARLFLIEQQQFEDVVAQENSANPAEITVDIDDTVAVGHSDVRERGWYRRVVFCGEVEGLPVLTCTAAWDVGEVEPVAPSVAYLRWLAAGLRESWSLSGQKIAEYLLVAPGMAASYSSELGLRDLIEQLIEGG